MRPIRIYVFHKARDCEWINSTHREFDEAVAAVALARTGNDGVCFVHVGISRPPNQDFEPVVAKISNCVLLTASARWAFDGTGDYSHSVASVGKLRLHVALDGWGVVSEEARALKIDAVVGLTSPWLEHLAKIDSALSAQVHARGVVDDTSYFEQEKNFSWRMKQRVGIERMQFLMSGADHQDPSQVVKACPAWLLATSLSNVNLTVRCANALRAQSFDRVSDLVGVTPNDYMCFPNMGKKTVADLAEALWKEAKKGPNISSERDEFIEAISHSAEESSQEHSPESHSADMPAHHRSFRAAFAASLADLPDNQRSIIYKRVGIDCERLTLQDVAEEINLTRERVRQIESKAVQLFKEDSVWESQFLPRIAKIIDDRDDPMPVASIGVFDAWFEGVVDLLPQFNFILARVFDDRYCVLRINGCDFVTKLSQSDWNQVLRVATNTLERAVGNNLSKNELRVLIQDLLVTDGRELASELWSTVQSLALFAPDQNGVQRLVAMGMSAESLVAATLAGSDRPLHFTEIPARVEVMFGRKIELRRAHSAAANQGLLLGRGTFGVARHYPLSTVEKEMLNAETSEIILSGPIDRQWSCFELVKALASRELPFSERIDQYVLNIALQDEPSVSNLGRLVWTRSGTRPSTTADRIDVMQAVMTVLANYGAPMTRNEIRRALLDERGLSGYFQLNSRGSLVRVSSDKWGILERDIDLTHEERKTLRDHAENLMEQSQAGFHSDEIMDVLLPRMPAIAKVSNSHALVSILLIDERFRTSMSGYVYLKSWEGPRRMSHSDAIIEVLRQAKGHGMPGPEIARRATMLLGREIDKTSVYAAFRLCSAKFDEHSGTWTLAEDDEDEQKTQV